MIAKKLFHKVSLLFFLADICGNGLKTGKHKSSGNVRYTCLISDIKLARGKAKKYLERWSKIWAI